jgi:hypothetical protein
VLGVRTSRSYFIRRLAPRSHEVRICALQIQPNQQCDMRGKMRMYLASGTRLRVAGQAPKPGIATRALGTTTETVPGTGRRRGWSPDTPDLCG